MGILLFGDSVDFRIPKYLCNLVVGEEPQPFMTESGVDGRELHLAGECSVPCTAGALHWCTYSLWLSCQSFREVEALGFLNPVLRWQGSAPYPL